MTETSKLTRHSIRLDKQTFCKQNGRCIGLKLLSKYRRNFYGLLKNIKSSYPSEK